MQVNGCQFTIVAPSSCPRFAYTTGLKDELGVDFLLPGLSRFSDTDLVNIVEQCVTARRNGQQHAHVRESDDFEMRSVDSSWVEMLALGALKHYGARTPFLQIAQSRRDSTIDTPDTSKPWSASTEPVWKWLKDPWTLGIPAESTVTTNLAALRGSRVTEVTRWETDEWELFAGSGPDTPKDELRILPLATFLAADPSIAAVVKLQIGEGLWREADELDWHVWEKAT
jgi:hypothetical protein